MNQSGGVVGGRRTLRRRVAVLTLVVVAASCGGDSSGEREAVNSQLTQTTTTAPTTDANAPAGTAATAPPPTEGPPGAVATNIGTIVIVSVNGPTTIIEAVRVGSTVDAVAQLDDSLISATFVNGAVWVGLFDRVAIVDVATGAVEEVPIPGASAGLLMLGDEQAVWASGFGPLARIDTTTREITGQYDLAASPFPAGATAVGAAAGYFYFVDATATNLSRFDGDVVTLVGVLPFEFSGGDEDESAVNAGTLYVGDMETGIVALVDAATGEINTVEVTRPLLSNEEVDEAGRPVTFTTIDNGVVVTFGPASAIAGNAPDAPFNGFAIARIEPDGTVTPEERFAPGATVVAAAFGSVVVQTLVDLAIIEPESNQETLLTPSGALVDSVYILTD